MFDTDDHKDGPTDQATAVTWKPLLDKVEQGAHSVADLVMSDSVLADSVMQAISAYMSQRDRLAALRDQFAEADTFCRDLRQEAKELMASLGYEGNWRQEDISAVDSQLLHSMKEAGEKAAAINKSRNDANKLAEQLLNRAMDEIALCASIVVLRQVDQYSGEGESFCVAYIATFIVREKAIEDLPASKAVTTLKDWLKYSSGVKNKALELDLYAHNRVAAGIGNGMGLMTSNALHMALIGAMNNMNAPES